MKKTLLFLTFFLFFAFLNAGEVQPETTEKTDLNGVQKENHEKPKIFYIQPAIVITLI